MFCGFFYHAMGVGLKGEKKKNEERNDEFDFEYVPTTFPF